MTTVANKTTIAQGNQLPASPHRDANKLYVSDRNLSILEQLGVTGDKLIAARRGDELLDSTGSTNEVPRKDGRLTLSELDRLDETPNRSALLPNEAAAVGSVHKLFEIPDSTQMTLQKAKTIKYSLDKRLVDPAVSRIRIVDLDQTLQTSAKRLQQVKNTDGAADTIELDDVLWAKDDHNKGAFTATTHADFDRIRALFHDDIYAETVTAVLAPNLQTQPLVHAGLVKVDLENEIQYGHKSEGNLYSLVPSYAKRRLIIDAPEGHKVFVKSTGQLGSQVGFFDRIVEGSGAPQKLDAPLDLSGNSVWIQIFDPDGAVIANKRLELPAAELDPVEAIDETGRKVDHWHDVNGDDIPQRGTQLVGYYYNAKSRNEIKSAILVTPS